jgi:uncharacterized protein YozE (UPF0346 family)
MSFFNQVQLPDDAVENTLTWTPDSIMIDVASSMTDNNTTSINLVPTLGHNTKIKALPKSADDVYWLPAYYNANNVNYRDHQIAHKFIAACKVAGFSLAMKGWEKSKSKDLTPGWGWIIFRCTRGRHHIEPKDEEQGPTSVPTKAKNYRAQRPIKGEDTCKCHFKVFFDPTRNRWYLPKKQGGNASHLGHRKKDPKLVRVRAATICPESTEDAVMQLKEQNHSSQVSSPASSPFKDNSGKESWVYAKLMPLYRQITEYIETKDDFAIAKECFDQIHAQLMERSAKRKGPKPVEGQNGRAKRSRLLHQPGPGPQHFER